MHLNVTYEISKRINRRGLKLLRHAVRSRAAGVRGGGGKRLPLYKNCTSKHVCYRHEFTMANVFLKNLARISTSCSEMK